MSVEPHQYVIGVAQRKPVRADTKIKNMSHVGAGWGPASTVTNRVLNPRRIVIIVC